MILNKHSWFHGLSKKQRKGRQVASFYERNWYNLVSQHLVENLWKSVLLSRNNHNCIFFVSEDCVPGYCLCFHFYGLKNRYVYHYRQILIKVQLHSSLQIWRNCQEILHCIKKGSAFCWDFFLNVYLLVIDYGNIPFAGVGKYDRAVLDHQKTIDRSEVLNDS